MWRELQRNRRHLIFRMSRPLHSAAVLGHFLAHPWFEAPVGAEQPVAAPVILGTTGGAPVALGEGFAVGSWAVLPQWPMPAAIATGPASLLASSAFEADQKEICRRLEELWRWDGPSRTQLNNWLITEQALHPDLVRAVYDWQHAKARIWLATVRGACALAVHLLSRFEILRNDLRYCDRCRLPLFPDPRKVGRPLETCPTCGQATPSHAARHRRSGQW